MYDEEEKQERQESHGYRTGDAEPDTAGTARRQDRGGGAGPSRDSRRIARGARACLGPKASGKAGIDTWVNGESVNNQDVVIWYGAHVTHDVAAEPPGTFGHIVGPDLKLVKW